MSNTETGKIQWEFTSSRKPFVMTSVHRDLFLRKSSVPWKWQIGTFNQELSWLFSLNEAERLSQTPALRLWA